MIFSQARPTAFPGLMSRRLEPPSFCTERTTYDTITLERVERGSLHINFYKGNAQYKNLIHSANEVQTFSLNLTAFAS